MQLGFARFRRARRAEKALLTNGISSLGNLALSIAIAREGSVSEFGAYSIAFSMYLLVTGAVRASVTEAILAEEQSPELLQRAARRVSCMGAILSAAIVTIGVVFGFNYLIVIGVALHGLTIYDFIKVVNIAAGSPSRTLAQELIWTAASAAAVSLALLGVLSPLLVFLAWSVIGALIGYVHLHLIGCSVLPGWDTSRTDSRASMSFGLEFLAGAGIAQLTIAVLGGAAGTAVVGALRGAGTVLAPLSLIVGTARPLLIPHLGRGRDAGVSEQLIGTLKAALVMISIVAPLAILVTLIPDVVGQALLGESWRFAEPVLPAVACEFVLAAAVAPAFAGHRVHVAGRRALIIRAVLAPVHIGAIVGAGVSYGAIGAALAMVAMAVLQVGTWWTSYIMLVRTQLGSPKRPHLG